jgi:hypothetical protein
VEPHSLQGHLKIFFINDNDYQLRIRSLSATIRMIIIIILGFGYRRSGAVRFSTSGEAREATQIRTVHQAVEINRAGGKILVRQLFGTAAVAELLLLETRSWHHRRSAPTGRPRTSVDTPIRKPALRDSGSASGKSGTRKSL